MSGLPVTFVLLPSIAAVICAWAVRHWALGAALFFGAVGLLFLASNVPLGDLRFGMPFFTGAGVAGLVLAIGLLIRPGMSLWSRLSLALLAAFAVHYAYLHFALSQV